MDRPKSLEIEGILEVSTYRYRDNRNTGSFRHYLNLSGEFNDVRFTDYDMTHWLTDAWVLKNGIAERIPHTYSPVEYRRENAGIAFLAYFPIVDFNRLLKEYRKEEAASMFAYYKERGFQLLRGIRTKLTGVEYINVSISTHGVSIKDPDASLKKTRESYEWVQIEEQDLSRRLKMAGRWGLDYIIIQRGFGLAECLEGDESTTEAVIIGSRPYTEKLMERLGSHPQATEVLTDLFSPAHEGIRYDSWGSREMEDYKNPPFSTGQYHPFKNMRELRVFDYRRSKQNLS